MLSVHPIRKQSAYTFNDITSEWFAFECFGFSSWPGVGGTTATSELSAALIATFHVNRMKIGRVVEGSDGSDGDGDRWPIAVADGR